MIALRAGDAIAEIVPERGAVCSRLALLGNELLYLDPATLADPQKNVRGGIPVLFPIAGKPEPGSPLKQHGFARSLAWEPTLCGADRLECRLREGGFDLLIAFTLSERALRLDATVDGDAPFQLGFHPYFDVSDKSAARVETAATRALDNRSGVESAFAAPDFTQELDLRLLDHREAGTVLHRGAQPEIRLRWSPEFTLLVLWTLPDRNFICVEPWTRRSLDAPASLSFEISVG